MHYNLKKPTDVCVRGFVSRVQELNSYLAKFTTEAPNVPATSLGEDEVKDISFHALLQSWKKQMTLHGFKCPAQDIVEMVHARTNAEFENDLSSMIEHIFPVHAYHDQKRYVIYSCRTS